jgi:hypothetical protein
VIRTLFVLGIFLIAGCAHAAAVVLLRTERRSYEPGERVVVWIANGTTDTVFTDSCGGEVRGPWANGQYGDGEGFARECDDFGAAGWRRTSRSVAPGTQAADTLPIESLLAGARAA